MVEGYTRSRPHGSSHGSLIVLVEGSLLRRSPGDLQALRQQWGNSAAASQNWQPTFPEPPFGFFLVSGSGGRWVDIGNGGSTPKEVVELISCLGMTSFEQ